MSTPPSVLFVEDDADVRRAADLLLRRRGFALHVARTPAEAWSLLAAEPIDAVLLDLNFEPGATSGAEGLAWLKEVIAHDPDCVVVIVTGHSGVNIAVAAMRAGASDFVMKPWNNERLVATLTDAVALRRQRRAQRNVTTLPDDEPIIGDSIAMRRVLEVAHRVAATDAPVLLMGETGTGKTLLAHAIHRLSRHRDRALASVDPAAAWSQGEAALIAALDRVEPGGTLVLDEIAGLQAAAQITLASRLPSSRLIATTRRTRDSLRAEVQPDLLHKLNVLEIALPPLRDRDGDATLLAEHYLRLFAHRYGRATITLSPDATDAIGAHTWPGNVRELRLAVERATVLAPGDVVRARDIPLAAPRADDVDAPAPGNGDLNLARSERAVVEAALRRHGFNVSHAAKELGLTRAALYRRMARHRL